MAQRDEEEFCADIIIKRKTPTSHTNFYEVVSGFIEKADIDDILPIIRVQAHEAPFLLVAVIVGCLRRNDDTSILIYPNYGLVAIAAATFLSLMGHSGGHPIRITTVDRTYIVVQFSLLERQRNMVFGIPAVYDCPEISLLAFNLIHDPSGLLPEDDEIDPIVIVAVARGLEKTVIKTDTIPHVGVTVLFQ